VTFWILFKMNNIRINKWPLRSCSQVAARKLNYGSPNA
jgi:hypothetical protein